MIWIASCRINIRILRSRILTCLVLNLIFCHQSFATKSQHVSSSLKAYSLNRTLKLEENQASPCCPFIKVVIEYSMLPKFSVQPLSLQIGLPIVEPSRSLFSRSITQYRLLDPQDLAWPDYGKLSAMEVIKFTQVYFNATSLQAKSPYHLTLEKQGRDPSLYRKFGIYLLYSSCSWQFQIHNPRHVFHLLIIVSQSCIDKQSLLSAITLLIYCKTQSCIASLFCSSSSLQIPEVVGQDLRHLLHLLHLSIMLFQFPKRCVYARSSEVVGAHDIQLDGGVHSLRLI